MQRIIIPDYVDKVLSLLETAGYEAYAVGGCCRDVLLGRIPQDWDICTSAKPDDTMRIFPHSIPTGIKHGTVMVKLFGKTVEVTTYRVDGAYFDHRRPDNVRFTESLYEDLSRRDFTMNALAMDRRGKIIDPFGGTADIIAKIIRCVGNAEMRFAEDALRMFRAIRFSAQLGFELDVDIIPAVERLADTAALIAAERVQTETKKILLSPSPEKLEIGIRLGLYDRYILPGKAASLSPLQDVPADELMRFGALCALLRKDLRIKSAEDFLRSLRCDTNTVRAVSMALDPEPVWLQEDSLPSIAARVGRKFALCTAAAMQVSGVQGAVEKMSELLSEHRCLSISELNITGEELMQLGFFGRDIGKIMEILLRHVLQNPESNSNAALIDLAARSRGNN